MQTQLLGASLQADNYEAIIDPNHKSILKNKDIVSFDFGGECICTLTKDLWMAISPYFKRKIESELKEGVVKLAKNNNINLKHLQIFIQILEGCPSNPLSYHNFKDIFTLANKYQVSIIKKNCEEHFDAHSVLSDLTMAVDMKLSKAVQSSVVRIIRDKIQFPPKMYNTLLQLANDHQLADLKLCILGCNNLIPSTQTLVLSNQSMENFNQLAYHILTFNNSWHSPQILLEIHDPTADDLEELKELLNLKIVPNVRFCFDDQPIPYYFAKSLDEIPHLKTVDILINAKDNSNTLNQIDTKQENQGKSCCIL